MHTIFFQEGGGGGEDLKFQFKGGRLFSQHFQGEGVGGTVVDFSCMVRADLIIFPFYVQLKLLFEKM